MLSAIAPVAVTVGPYTLIRPLGEGGMAHVYLAEHRWLGRRVALKMLRPGFVEVAIARDRLVREAQIGASVRHPNLVEIVDMNCDAAVGPYYVMEALDGETLGDRIARSGPLPASVAISLARQLAGALVALHTAGIVHRDVKADNVVLVHTRHGLIVKLIDFGISGWRGPTHACDTLDGALLGTPEYMAPEQIGGDTVDGLADAWGFGALMYEMVTGTRPFGGRRLRDILMAVIADEPPPLTLVVPRGLESLIRDCLRKEPDGRPTMVDIEHRLASVADRYESSARRLDLAIDAADPNPLPPQRPGLGSVLAAVAFVLVVVGGALSTGAAIWLADLEQEVLAPTPGLAVPRPHLTPARRGNRPHRGGAVAAARPARSRFTGASEERDAPSRSRTSSDTRSGCGTWTATSAAP